MKSKRPALISVVIDLIMLAVIVMIVSLIPGSNNIIGISFDVPIFGNVILRIALILILLAIAYGYFKLKKWGFWLAIFYSSAFLITSIICLIIQYNITYFNQQLIISSVVLIITLPTKRYFYTDESPIVADEGKSHE